MPEKNPVQSAGRIFSVLELLAEQGPMGVTEISTQLELNKSTVHRLLSSLIAMDYAKRNRITEKYYLSFKLVRLADQIAGQMDIVALAHPYLKELSAKCGETVHLVQREGDKILYIDKVESTVNSVRMVSQVGLAYPIFTTGVGKAMLAEMPAKKVERLWINYRPKKKTEHTITSFDDMLEELGQTKKRGYSLDNEENELGVRCIAGCVFNFRGKADNAFSISAPVSRMTDERVRELSRLVLEYREKISKAYGYMESD